MRGSKARLLAGRTIVVTRAKAQARPFTRLLRARGARVIEAPAIVLRPPRTWSRTDRALGRLRSYDIVIFTSVNGVEKFFDRLRRKGVRARDMRAALIVAIGPATRQALLGRGLRVAALPAEFRAEGIVRALARKRLSGARVLIPRAAVARDLLVRALRRAGAAVEVVPVYRTIASSSGSAAVRRALKAGRIDLLTFASSSSVEHFMRRFRTPADRRRLRAVPAAVIGPITAATARRLGLRVAIQPRRFTIPALADAIAKGLGPRSVGDRAVVD